MYAPDRDSLRMNCNLELVDLESVEESENIEELRELIEKHHRYTGSTVAEAILKDWDAALPNFVQVMPRDYKRALEELKAEAAADAAGEESPELAESH